MATFTKLEEMKIWEKGTSLTCKIYQQIKNNPLMRTDYNFMDQIRRSALSVPSNIAEGYERETKKEFIRFLAIAKGSCGELRTQVYIGHRLGYFTKETFQELHEDALSISRMISRLIYALREDRPAIGI